MNRTRSKDRSRLRLNKRQFDGVFPLRYSALLPPTPQFWGTFGQDFSFKSPKNGGFGGLLGFVTAARDLIEFTLNKDRE